MGKTVPEVSATKKIDPTPHLYDILSLLLTVRVLLLKTEDEEGRHSVLLCVFI